MVNKRAMYEPGAVMVCSQKRACCVVTLGFVAIIAVALIVAFTKPGTNGMFWGSVFWWFVFRMFVFRNCCNFFVFWEFEFNGWLLGLWKSVELKYIHIVKYFLSFQLRSFFIYKSFLSHCKQYNQTLISRDPGCPEATYTGEPLPGQSIRPTSSPPTTPPTATNGELFPWTSVRLPTHVRPLHYDLSLHPNLTTRYVKGKIQINCAVWLRQFMIRHCPALCIFDDWSFFIYVKWVIFVSCVM